MKARSIGYWVTTVLFALALGGSALGDLLRAPQVVEGVAHLGYPGYLVTLLGVWKVLGLVAVLVPGFPRLKEWAYAGFFFELSGAVFSHVASGDAGHLGAPLVLAALGMASWALRPEARRLGTLLAKRDRPAPIAAHAA